MGNYIKLYNEKIISVQIVKQPQNLVKIIMKLFKLFKILNLIKKNLLNL